MNKKISNLIMLVLALLAFSIPGVTNATGINSLTVGSSIYNSYQLASLTWTLAEAGKVSIFVSCQSGVKITSPDVSSASCNNAFQTANNLSSDAINLQVVNVSGNPQTITASVSPIDASGNVLTSSSQSVSFRVNPVNEPISSISSSATSSITSYQPVTITWTSVSEVSGANISLDCTSENISATSSVSTSSTIPCGQTISETDLPASGSATFSFYTNSVNKIPITIRVYPAISSKVYDAMHGVKVELTLQNRKAATPSISSSALNTSVVSDMAPVQISWKTADSQAVNLRIACSDGIQPYIYATTTNTFVTTKCGTLAYDSPLPVSGSTTLQFKNKGSNVEQVKVAVLPGAGDGTYDATVAKELVLNVYPAGFTSTQVGTVAPSTSSAQSNSIQTTATTNKSIIKVSRKITKTLYKGSSNSDVKELQSFLSQFKDLYPEGLATGYFGPATERAVKRFQEKYGIAKQGDAGYGTIGPKTRAKINDL